MSHSYSVACCAAVAAGFLMLSGCGGESSASDHAAPAHAPAAKSDHGGGGGHGAAKSSSHGGGGSKGGHGGGGGGHGAAKSSSHGGGGGGHGAAAKSSHGGGGHGAAKSGGHGSGGGHAAAAKTDAHAAGEKPESMQLLDGLRRTPEESIEVELGTFTISRRVSMGETLRVRFQLTALVDLKQEAEFAEALELRRQAMRDRVLELAHKLDLEHFDDPTLRALKSDLLVEIQRAVRSLAIHEVLVSDYVSERR